MLQNPFMLEAFRLAEEGMNNSLGGPFGCVVVKDGIIIGRGNNRVTSSNDPTAHAEIVAIREACQHLSNFQLDGCEIYTSCEPCPMCLGAIYWARPSKVYYASTREDAANIDFDDRFIYEEISRQLKERHIPMYPLMREEGLNIFRLWEAKENKVKY
jgi:tRNA(Arg) A34 adenosine deaminase TadA